MVECPLCHRMVEERPSGVYSAHFPHDGATHGYMCKMTGLPVQRGRFVFEIFCRAHNANMVITGSYHKPELEAENALAFVRNKTGDPNAVVWVIAKVDVMTIEEEK